MGLALSQLLSVCMPQHTTPPNIFVEILKQKCFDISTFFIQRSKTMISRDTFRNEWTGLATDDWTMSNPIFKGKIENGDTGFEMDTSKVKKWDEVGQQWLALN